MAFMFENLDVYQKAVDSADDIATVTEGLPRCYGFLVDQLNRAALSIATNLAEGNGRFTRPDRRSFFTIAQGSTQECVPLLEIARRRGFIQGKKRGRECSVDKLRCLVSVWVAPGLERLYTMQHEYN